MFIVAFVFGIIFFYELHYLRQANRKKRTKRIVVGFLLFCFLSFEALYYFREDFQFAKVIEFLFQPIETFIVWRDENG
ncbi:hypothetical protein [Brevibacillus choshinensis]|uniref:Uncharacterized protein n=1 Tax=Brevibacillus choshinensis TaxID=54911 RepID=A0ABX7FX54_BRECH|nr:hypothetical protein [Brevibacillus choshinensis]QRG70383.1 hypothetical protein JNE38_15485 [Brevibacillus choshinensis]